MIAIVDDAPEKQYLFPEFRLAKGLLEEYGVETVIADAKELHFDGKVLLIGGRPIDLVYNRLVDFALEELRHAALEAAYVGGNVVVRCLQGHLFTTIWIPGASLKAIRLGWWRLQRCPVGEHWTLVAPVRDADLSDEERLIAEQHRDIRMP